MCQNCIDNSTLNILYYSLVCSHIDYDSNFPYLSKLKLDYFQNNLLRCLFYNGNIEKMSHSDYNLSI